MDEIKKYKQSLLQTLYKPYSNSHQTLLETYGRTQAVFGSGNPDAHVVFIGEAPGQQEDLQGKPFVGRSGKLLDSIFERFGIQRKDVFITNIVKWRPPNNRKPTMLEMIASKPLLIDQIKIIRPQVICTLGSAPLEGILEQPVSITKARGKPLLFKNIPLIPTYHPAYILRNPSQLNLLAQDIKKAIELSKT
jgi:uracil-DNA glycosylase